MFFKLSNGKQNVGTTAHFPRVPSPERRIYIIFVSDLISLQQAKLTHSSLFYEGILYLPEFDVLCLGGVACIIMKRCN